MTRRDYAGRRPTVRSGNVLPTGTSRLAPPDWPLGTPTEAEAELWRELWRRPVAALWRSTFTAPVVVARYVAVLLRNPASGSLAQMESALGLTPASLARMHVTFEEPRPPLSDTAEAVLALAATRNGS